MKRKLVFLLLSMAFVAGCQQPSQGEQDQKRKDQANLEAEEQAKADQNKLNEQSLKLEKDLQRRYRFYNAVNQEYTGKIKISGTEYGISFKSQPTIPLYTGDRVRTVEEVQTDLNNLGLDGTIRFWNLKNTQAASGCQFSGVKGFYENGSFKLQSTECGNIFNVFFSQKIISSKEFEKIETTAVESGAAVLSQAILEKKQEKVAALIVQMQSTLNGTTQNFQLEVKK